MPALSPEAHLSLRIVIRANSAVCLIGGLVFILAADMLATLLGLPSSGPLTALGVVLLPYALFVYLTSTQVQPSHRRVWFITVMDVGWVILSALLVVTNVLAFTEPGRILVLGQAVLVLIFVVVQVYLLQRTTDRTTVSE